MITEVEQIKKWFMEKHGVSKYVDIKAADGDYIIPINRGVCLVTIKNNTIAGIQVNPPATETTNEH